MDLQRICRTCAIKSCDLLPIHDIKYSCGKSSITFPSLIENCFQLKVSKDDGLPQNICTSCLEKLARVYDFKEKCQKSAETFSMLLGIATPRIDANHCTDKSWQQKLNGDVIQSENVYPLFTAMPMDHDYAKDKLTNNGTPKKDKSFYSVKPSFYKIVKRVKNSMNCSNYPGPPVESTESDENESPANDLEFESDTVENDYTRTRSTQTDSTVEHPADNMATVSKSRVFKCPACDEKKIDKNLLVQHIMEKHTIKTECLICESKEIRYMRAHCFNHLPKKQTCMKCGKRFILRKHLNFHKKTAAKQCFHCETCDVDFCVEKDYHWHMEKHKIEESNPNEIIKCCGREFLSAADYKQHRIYSHTQTVFTCNICSQTFDTRQELIEDQIKHRMVKKMKSPCPICNKIMRNANALAYHVRKMHDETQDTDEITRRRCNICFMVCSTRQLLYRHKATHMIQRKFQCKICKREYSRKKQLHYHMEGFHNNLRRFECKPCGKTFKYNSNLFTHYSTKMHQRNTSNNSPTALQKN